MAGEFFNKGTAISAVSMAASITSNPVHIENQDNIGLAFSWSGTPTGTFSVEVCNDYNVATGTATWIALTFNPTLTAPAGSAGAFWTDIIQTAAEYFRVKYTRVSGTGSLTVTYSAKAI